MNLMPLLGFYYRQHAQISQIFGGDGSGKGSEIVIELASTAVPLLKKHWPAYNANGLLDDALSTLKEVLAPPTPTPPLDINSQS